MGVDLPSMKASNWLIVSVGVVAFGCLGWLVVQNRRLSADHERDQFKRSTTAQNAHGNHESRQHEAGEGQKVTSTNSPQAQDSGSFVGLPWKDSAWRAARFDEAYFRVEAEHGRFFQKLVGWSPERIEALKRQLAYNSLTIMQAATQSDGTDGNTVGEAIQSADEKNKQQLRETLGEKHYTAFEESKRIETYRQSIGIIVNAMRSNSIQISADKEESILTAYAEAIKTAAQNLSPGDNDISKLGPDELAALKKKQMAAFNHVLFEKMSAVFDENQMNTFMQAALEHQNGG